jgi:hypothetical protein
MSANYTYRIPKDASYVTLRNQNRILYANYIIQQNNVSDGCQIRVALQNGGVADADIVPKLLEGARETTVEERDRILASESCPIPVSVPTPQPAVPTGLGGSMLFNNLSGNGSQVLYPNNAALALGNGDFTIEWFQYFTDDTTFARAFSIGSYLEGDTSIAVSYESTIYFWNGMTPNAVYNQNPPLNAWTHIAIVGTGGTSIALYIDGTREFNGSISYNFTQTTLSLAIGNETVISNNSGAFGGQITNFRWVKGTALYSGASLTVPTQPLTAVSGTQLLLLASSEANAFADSSPANRTPTNNGATFSSTTPF